MTYNQQQDMVTGRLTMDEVSYHDAMGFDAAPRDGEYSYMMTERPFSIGCQPKSGLVRYEESELPKGDSGYYGIVVYNRMLTIDEIQRYELVPVGAK